VTETKAFILRCQGKLPMSNSISSGEWESKAVSHDSNGGVMQSKDHPEFRNQNLECFKVLANWTCTLLPTIQEAKLVYPSLSSWHRHYVLKPPNFYIKWRNPSWWWIATSLRFHLKTGNLIQFSSSSELAG
jgi:hypothetical protein